MMLLQRTNSKLRLGLLLDSTFTSKYVFEFVKWAETHQELDIVHLYIAAAKPGEPRAASILSGLFFRLAKRIERLMMLKNKRHYDHLRRFDLTRLLPNNTIEVIRANAFSVPEELKLDLLISFSSSRAINMDLKAVKFGLVRVAHSDDLFVDADLAGFWEVYFRRDTTTFAIKQSIGNTGSDQILLRGKVATQFYYCLNQASLHEKSIHYLAKIVEHVAVTRELPEPQLCFPSCQRPHGIPEVHETMRYFARLVFLSARKLLDKLRGYDLRWHVGFVRTGWRNAAFWRATIIQSDPGRYLADPFVISRGGRDVCYVEDYNQATDRGRIVAYELGLNSATCLGVALEEGFHLSFPYLFEYQNQLYMCPETSEKREIRIYRCVEFPLGWQFEKTIMRDIAAVDSLLFEKDGKWWIMTNTDPAGWSDFSLELRIFSATTPLDENWLPHPLNPLFIDASRTRNGGMVRDGSRVFRVAQGQGFGMYGKRTLLNEVVELTEHSYQEESVCVISPKFRKGALGTHHLNSYGALTVFDFASR